MRTTALSQEERAAVGARVLFVAVKITMPRRTRTTTTARGPGSRADAGCGDEAWLLLRDFAPSSVSGAVAVPNFVVARVGIRSRVHGLRRVKTRARCCRPVTWPETARRGKRAGSRRQGQRQIKGLCGGPRCLRPGPTWRAAWRTTATTAGAMEAVGRPRALVAAAAAGLRC